MFKMGHYPINSELINKLQTKRDDLHLIQEGLSFFSSNFSQLQIESKINSVRCLINIENWTKWTLNEAMIKLEYGTFQKSKFNYSQFYYSLAILCNKALT